MKKISAMVLLVLVALPSYACICGIISTCGSIECQGHDSYPGISGSDVFCTGACSTTYTGIISCGSGSAGGVSLPPVTCSATCTVISSYTGASLTCSGSKIVYPTGPDTKKCG